ncbi:protein MobC [Desulfovibrio sp. OttesenSCG-928-M14]|nr:protein MobC [Desulfovibrio sp. OttesenSCG-928-M14]
MNITTAQVKEIRLELAKLKPVKVTLDGNRSMTVKEAIFALAPTLERMKKRGFDTQEIAEKLHEKGIDVKPPTLAKYLNEFRRGKDKKKDTPPQPEKIAPAPQPDRLAPPSRKGLVITPDTPLDEL